MFKTIDYISTFFLLTALSVLVATWLVVAASAGSAAFILGVLSQKLNVFYNFLLDAVCELD